MLKKRVANAEKRPDSDVVAQWCDLIKEGYTIASIAEHFKTTVYLVSKYTKELCR